MGKSHSYSWKRTHDGLGTATPAEFSLGEELHFGKNKQLILLIVNSALVESTCGASWVDLVTSPDKTST
jgi:hypothetical protein